MSCLDLNIKFLFGVAATLGKPSYLHRLTGNHTVTETHCWYHSSKFVSSTDQIEHLVFVQVCCGQHAISSQTSQHKRLHKNLRGDKKHVLSANMPSLHAEHIGSTVLQ